MEAGRKMDVLVAEKVMGWRIVPAMGEAHHLVYWSKGPNGYEGEYEADSNKRWSPSTDIAAAWRVIEQSEGSSKHGVFWDIRLDKTGWEAMFYRGNNEQFRGKGTTAPEAICRAALAAAGVDNLTPTAQ